MGGYLITTKKWYPMKPRITLKWGYFSLFRNVRLRGYSGHPKHPVYPSKKVRYVPKADIYQYIKTILFTLQCYLIATG